MARALSHVHSIIRGSVGGLTYLANQYHQIVMRARTAPVDPRTGAQTLVRTAISGASAIWKSLSDAERQEWADYAQTIQYAGPLGPYNASGRHACLGVVTAGLYVNSAISPITPLIVDGTPPTESGWLTPSTIEAVPFTGTPATGVAVQVTNVGSEDLWMYGEISNAFHPSRQRFKGPFVASSLEIVGASTPGTGTIEWDGLKDGNVYFARVRCYEDSASPRISSEHILRLVAETNP